MRKLKLQMQVILDGSTDNETKQGITSSYASVNGLKMYYEIHGTGTPLV